jgi:hypothetical protein
MSTIEKTYVIYHKDELFEDVFYTDETIVCNRIDELNRGNVLGPYWYKVLNKFVPTVKTVSVSHADLIKVYPSDLVGLYIQDLLKKNDFDLTQPVESYDDYKNGNLVFRQKSQ